ncbi:MAG: hypothetical protein U5N86_08215 [Planctomycetota bacterium]|nr:hypothetical protein [Planctomycetota bacterium]
MPVCKACANQTGSLDAAMEQGLPVNDEMFGHPPMQPAISQRAMNSSVL